MSGDIKRYVIIGSIVGVVVLIIALVATSLQKLASDEVGISYDTINKKMGDSPKLEGLHVGPPGFTFVKFPSVFETFTFTNLRCLNKDGVQIRLSISYQYRIRPKELKSLVLQFEDFKGFKEILRPLGESSIHDVCSKFNTSQFQAERGVFQEQVRERLIQKYDRVSCDVTDLQVNDIQRPPQYESAVRSKESAREEIEVATNERPKKLTEATTEKRQSETQATITMDKAQSAARILENRATAEAEGIINEYKEEAKTYKSLMDSNGLNSDGFLAYMGVRAIEDQKNPVYIGMDSPAKTDWGI